MLGPPSLGMIFIYWVIAFFTIVRDWSLPFPVWRFGTLDLGRVVESNLVFLLVSLIGIPVSGLAVMIVESRRWHHPCLAEPSEANTPDLVLWRLQQVVFVLSAAAVLIALRVAGWWSAA